MIIPVLCFTCGKTLGDKYDWYQNEVKKLIKEKENKEGKVKVPQKHKKIEESLVYFDDIKTGDILDKLGLTRSCCRRHMLGHVDMMKVI